jgi:hypothetical protein
VSEHQKDLSNAVVATTGVCGQCNSVHTARVYHRDYPEVWAEGESAARAAAELLDRLSRVLDSASDRWRSEPVRSAIADVRAFVAQGDARA